jgi:hypothetical protein
MSFNVHGDLPTPLPDSFCLGFGQPKAGCFPVISGTINAGGIKLLLVNNPQDKADFTFYAHSNAIRIAELNLYGLSTADSPPWSATISVSSVDNDGFDDTIVTFPNWGRNIGNSHAQGDFDIVNSLATPQGTPFGADAQHFGILANRALTLAGFTQINIAGQGGTVPKIGAATARIGGQGSYLTGDLVTSDSSGRAISLSNDDKVAGRCVTAGGSVVPAGPDNCDSINTTGSDALLTTLDEARVEATTYADYLAGLAPTKTLGDIALQKFHGLTIELGPGLNVVSIRNLTTDGGNDIKILAPSGAVVVFNISRTMQLGSQTRVIADGLNPGNLIWNVQGDNPIIGELNAFEGTLLNFPAADTTVTIGAGSVINGAVLVNGNVKGKIAMCLNFWPFSGYLPTMP